MPLDLDRMEIERITNLIRNFDWTVSQQVITLDKITLTVEHPRPAPPAEGTEGAD